MKKIQENVFRFTTMLMGAWVMGMLIILGILVFGFKELNFKIVVIMATFFFIFFVWFRVEKQGIVVDLNKRLIRLKANYFTAFFTPFGKFKQRTINLDEIISAAVNFDIDIRENTKGETTVSTFYSINITGTFGSKAIIFLTRETAQSLYSMISIACNFN